MKTHNVGVFHCVHCGRVSHIGLELDAPYCCGHAMAKAAEDTIRDVDVEVKGASLHTDASPLTITNQLKPR